MQVNLIEQNLAAQDNILAALTDVYAQTGNIRKNVEETLKRREMMISSLINSYDAYEDLLAKSSKGLEFYRKLEINVTKLLQRVKSTCKVQEEEREQILAQDSKNTYEKTDATMPSTYDQGRIRSNNGLKLKDYLNSKMEGGTGYQNPYYNLYKGHTATLQMDSVPKSLVTDTGNKNVIQSPNTIPVSEIPSSSTRSSQPYYPTTYTDYRISSSSYPYSAQTYYENPIALNQSSLSTTNTNATGVYQQPGLSATATDVSNSSIQYPANSYQPNGQTLPASITQEKFRGVAHNSYNTILQYHAYQSPADYNSYNVATPYVSNQEKTAIKSGITKVSSQIQSVSTKVPVSTIGTAVNSTMSTDDQWQVSYSVAQQPQQYDNQQKTTLSQDISHGGQNIAVRSQQTLSSKDNTLTQNYSLPQTGHAEMTYLQNYQQNTTYYNPAELQTQRVPYTHSTYDTTVVPPTQYVQSQLPSTNNHQSIHSVTSTSENSASYPLNLHNINSVQYSQQTNTEQSKQNYADKSYAGYGTQMNAGAQNYPSTYQTYQHGTAGTSYQQQSNMLSGDTSNAYGYLNNSSSSEIIQSHAKPTTVQSYSQSYQYPQQVPYSGYVQYPNYLQNQNYNYMQNAHGTNTVAYAYNANEAQGYAYASNLQSTETSQASQEATVSITSSDVTAGSIHYQQQETNARYTNAGNNAVVSQTQSSQYKTYQPQMESDTYYSTPYGLQMQGQSMLYIFR